MKKILLSFNGYVELHDDTLFVDSEGNEITAKELAELPEEDRYFYNILDFKDAVATSRSFDLYDEGFEIDSE